MFSKLLLVVAFALTGGMSWGATQETYNVEVTVKGIMQEDKGGMYIVADGQYYDLIFGADSNADMKKFYSGLEGDLVRIKGNLIVDRSKDGKVRLLVLANDVARLRGERPTVVKVEPRIIEEPPIYIEREPRRGIHLPGVHINW